MAMQCSYCALEWHLPRFVGFGEVGSGDLRPGNENTKSKRYKSTLRRMSVSLRVWYEYFTSNMLREGDSRVKKGLSGGRTVLNDQVAALPSSAAVRAPVTN